MLRLHADADEGDVAFTGRDHPRELAASRDVPNVGPGGDQLTDTRRHVRRNQVGAGVVQVVLAVALAIDLEVPVATANRVLP